MTFGSTVWPAPVPNISRELPLLGYLPGLAIQIAAVSIHYKPNSKQKASSEDACAVWPSCHLPLIGKSPLLTPAESTSNSYIAKEKLRRSIRNSEVRRNGRVLNRVAQKIKNSHGNGCMLHVTGLHFPAHHIGPLVEFQRPWFRQDMSRLIDSLTN